MFVSHIFFTLHLFSFYFFTQQINIGEIFYRQTIYQVEISLPSDTYNSGGDIVRDIPRHPQKLRDQGIPLLARVQENQTTNDRTGYPFLENYFSSRNCSFQNGKKQQLHFL